MTGSYGLPYAVFAVLMVLSMSAPADAGSTRAWDFLAPHGIEQFPRLYRQALNTFLNVEALYWDGHYGQAQRQLGYLWKDHPPSGDDWAGLPRQAAGLNIGSPPCYYALRMLTDCVEWRTSAAATADVKAHEVTLTVVLVGHGEGVQPTNWAELEGDGGEEVQLDLHPLLLQADHRVIHQSLRLFNEYMHCITGGRLTVQIEVVHLTDVTVPLRAAAKPHRFAGLGGGSWELIWNAVPEEISAKTDWWWVLYPCFVPEQHADFETTEFITGGMGRGPGGATPCFIIDDRWLTRKPPHLGKGEMSDIERRAYLPQWLQHEFYHHLFQRFPEYGLEAQGHQWFDRSTWPDDFVGRFEPDYYYEALHKLIMDAKPPMHVRLRYAPPPKELFAGITVESLVGKYRHEPMQNDWHEGEIAAATDDQGNPVLRWTNKAGVSWLLTPDLAEGVLRTGPDNPYYGSSSPGGRTFNIELARDDDGEYLPALAGFQFQSGSYGKIKE